MHVNSVVKQLSAEIQKISDVTNVYLKSSKRLFRGTGGIYDGEEMRSEIVVELIDNFSFSINVLGDFDGTATDISLPKTCQHQSIIAVCKTFHSKLLRIP